MTPYARLTHALEQARPLLSATDPAGHLQALEDLKAALHTEADTAHRAAWTARLSDVPCCECGMRVLNHPDYLRLRLCTVCMCCGLMAVCVTCGENYPEHHPGGRGCAHWQRREDVPPVFVRAGIPLPDVEERAR